MESRVVPGTLSNLLSIRDPIEHAARRRLWQRGLTAENIKGYEASIAKRALQLLDVLKKEAQENEDVDLVRWLGYFAFDFMGDMA